jgi:hypothetical protein
MKGEALTYLDPSSREPERTLGFGSDCRGEPTSGTRQPECQSNPSACLDEPSKAPDCKSRARIETRPFEIRPNMHVRQPAAFIPTEDPDANMHLAKITTVLRSSVDVQMCEGKCAISVTTRAPRVAA